MVQSRITIGAAIGQYRGESYICVLHGGIVAILAQGGTEQSKDQQGKPCVPMAQDFQWLSAGEGRDKQSDYAAGKETDGHQPVRGDTAVTEHYLPAGTADCPAQTSA